MDLCAVHMNRARMMMTAVMIPLSLFLLNAEPLMLNVGISAEIADQA